MAEPAVMTTASVEEGLGARRIGLHQGEQRCLFKSPPPGFCAPAPLICLLLRLTSSHLGAHWEQPPESKTSAARRSREVTIRCRRLVRSLFSRADSLALSLLSSSLSD